MPRRTRLESESAHIVGIVVVTHGPLGDALLSTATALAGQLEAVRAITINPEHTHDSICERISWAAKQVDRGRGVLFLVDLGGSTPANACLAECKRHSGAEVISGVNLPMILELETANREDSPTNLAAQLQEVGRLSIGVFGRRRTPG